MELIDRLIAPGEGTVLSHQDGFTPRAASLLEDSASIAHLLGDEAVGTEHILFAILRDVECVAARLLHTLGISLQKLYTDLASVMGIPEEKYKDNLEILKAAPIPNVAIGGLTPENCGRPLELGASGLAVAGGILGADSITEAVRRFQERLRENGNRK